MPMRIPAAVLLPRLRTRVNMNKNELFVEHREQEGDYAVRRPGAARASATAPTQAEAIEVAQEMEPTAAILVERVRNTSVGGRDKWRTP